MIVCACHNVSEKDIIRLLPGDLYDIMWETKAATCCGLCREALEKVVEEKTPQKE